ncbi:hypothetical protein [Nocardioides aquiterrae]|uniref:Uncharacterized protein n=1 Tax=Nocardioides aquiterrae TaxID=203799 RepID=A0ABN1UC66_9ACTN
MIAPDDPRHGTRAGYQAHRRANEDACDACLLGRAREDKNLRYDRHRGVQLLYSAAETYAVLEPWLALGLTYGGIGSAAGIGGTHGSRIGEQIRAGRPVRRATYLALATLTEADLDSRLKVYSGLTQARVFSLMAAGHPLSEMPIASTGKWRYSDMVTVGVARRVRDFYADHQTIPGRSAFTRSRARLAGHQPPAAWDDPGTLAWPLGWTSDLTTVDEVDEVAVQRILSGEWRGPANRAERVEVIRRWTARGGSLNELARRTGWKTDRYFKLSEQVAS